MKFKVLASVTGAAALAVGAIASWVPPSQAQMPTYFCGQGEGGADTTLARNAADREMEIIAWKNDKGGLTAKERCEIVSERFQAASEEGILEYITHGVQNGQPVICVAREYGGPCVMVLFTLDPEEDARKVLEGLFKIGSRASGPLIQADDGQPQIYIDMRKILAQ